MANYNSTSVFQPFIPKHLLTDEDRRIFEAIGITIDTANEEEYYLYAEGWCSDGYLEPDEPGGKDILITEDELLVRFQEIIRRSNGELTWISQESAYTCDRMRPDGLGGSAVFITAEEIQYCSTSQWMMQRIGGEVETVDIGPGTDDPPPEKPIVGIILEGGLVQSIVTNCLLDIPDLDVIIVDYDVDGADEEDLFNVPQGNSSVSKAIGHREAITEAGIDLPAVLNQMNVRGW